MMRCVVCWIALVVFCALAGGQMQSVKALAENGKIVVVDGTGRRRTISATGCDSQPQTSIDTREVVFLRSSPCGSEKAVKSGWHLMYCALNTETCSILISSPIRIGGYDVRSLSSPHFSADASMVFFLYELSAVTHGLASVTVASRAVTAFGDATTLEVIRAGKYKGYLLCMRRTTPLSGFPKYWYWLLGPDGKEVGLVGDTALDRLEFLERNGALR